MFRSCLRGTLRNGGLSLLAAAAAASSLVASAHATTYQPQPWGFGNCIPKNVTDANGNFSDQCKSGVANFVHRFDDGYNAHILPSMTQAFADWYGRHADRSEVFNESSTNGNAALYRNGLLYFHSHSIPTANLDGTGAPSGPLAQYALKDGPNGKPLYVKYGCDSSVHCSAYAGDITNSAFRAAMVQNMVSMYNAAAANGGAYKGIWLDDVIMDLRTTDAAQKGEHIVAPWSPTLNRYMTDADWRSYMALLVEDYRRALPRPIEFLINTPWNAGLNQGGVTLPDIQRVFKAATWMNIESGWTDTGIKEYGDWSMDAYRTWINAIHDNGAGVVYNEWSKTPTEREFGLASLLANTTGNDGIGEKNDEPADWWPGWDTNLGRAKSYLPTKWNGLNRRDFANGMVLTRDPSDSGVTTPITVTLPKQMYRLDGTAVTQVSLTPRTGAVLTDLPSYGSNAARADVLALGTGTGNTGSTLFQNTRRDMEASTPQRTLPTDAPINLTGDLDGDGMDELVSVYPGFFSGVLAKVVINWPRPNSYATPPATKTLAVALGNGTNGTYLADVTGDGKADLVTWNDTSITVAPNLLVSTSVQTWPIPADLHGDLTNAITDWTNDGVADLVTWTKAGVVRYAPSTRTGIAAPKAFLNDPSFVGSSANVVLDVPGDGSGGLIAIDPTGVRIVMNYNGQPDGMSDSRTYFPTPTGTFVGSSYYLKDMNYDGWKDLVVVKPSGKITYGTFLGSWGDMYVSNYYDVPSSQPLLGAKATLVGEFDRYRAYN